MNPEIDARLAERLREIATTQTDSIIATDLGSAPLPAHEKERVLNIAADLLEEYIMAARADAAPDYGPELTEPQFEAIMEIGHEVAAALGQIANPGASIDTGFGCGQYECFVSIGKSEYRVKVEHYIDEEDAEAA